MKVAVVCLVIIHCSIVVGYYYSRDGKACKKKYGGKCKSSCDNDDEITIHQDESCPEEKIYCCVDQDDTPCDKQVDGKCKEDCNSKTEIGIGITGQMRGRLCPSPEQFNCCVKKDDDLCKELKGGKCMTSKKCQKKNGKQTRDTLCFEDYGEICCVPNQACEQPVPGGICIDKTFCPEGYASAEELCIDIPTHQKHGIPRFKRWCNDKDEICCIKLKETEGTL